MIRKNIVNSIAALSLLVLLGWGAWYFSGRNKAANELATLHEKVAITLESSSIMSKDASLRLQTIEHQSFFSKTISNEDLDFCIQLFHTGTKATSENGKKVFPSECVYAIANCQSWGPGQEDKVKQLFEDLTQDSGPTATEANEMAAMSLVSDKKFPNRHAYLEKLSQSKFEEISKRAKRFLEHEKV